MIGTIAGFLDATPYREQSHNIVRVTIVVLVVLC